MDRAARTCFCCCYCYYYDNDYDDDYDDSIIRGSTMPLLGFRNGLQPSFKSQARTPNATPVPNSSALKIFNLPEEEAHNSELPCRGTVQAATLDGPEKGGDGLGASISRL